MYWHPGRKQVSMLTMHGDIPGVGRGVGEGSIKFVGETADGVLDLHQPRGRRKLGLRWVFDGSDKYHDTLLEDSGAGLKPLAEWDFVRIKEPSGVQPGAGEASPPKLAKHLRVFEPLLGHTWVAKVEVKNNAANAIEILTTLESVPSLEVITARVVAPRKDGEPVHLLDAYFYHHLGTNSLRCLALSNRGGVYEGNWMVLEGGALQIDRKGFEADRVVPLVVRLDFEPDGTLRQRIWSINGPERSLMLDVHHKKVESKKN